MIHRGDLVVDSTHPLPPRLVEVTGRLVIRGLAEPELDLGPLCAVGGNLEIVGNPGLGEVRGPDMLARIGGHVDVADNPKLTALEGLAALEAVGRSVVLFETAVRGLRWPKLASVGGSIDLVDNRQLNELWLPALESVGVSLLLEGVDALCRLHLPRLAKVGQQVHVERAPQLALVDVRALARQLRGHGFDGPIAFDDIDLG